jgi:fructokinase
VPDDEVLCVGELLWDSLPTGLFLGGAPFNVAGHLVANGVRAAIVSRVGVDRLGEEALRRARRLGVGTDLVQVDPVRSTGFVTATFDADGNPSYEILENVAWDAIALTDALVARVNAARAIVFGSLAQRSEITRTTIQRLLGLRTLKVFDVNLRPPHEDQDVVRALLERSDVVKLNGDELRQLARWFDLPAAERDAAAALSRSFACPVVVVTRGREGAGLWREGEWLEHPGFEVQVRDTVGAGDAFLAALLAGLLKRRPSAEILEGANRAGATVATKVGAGLT